MKSLAFRLFLPAIPLFLAAAPLVQAQAVRPPAQPARPVLPGERDPRPQTAQEIPVGTGVISGVVTMAGTSQPARKVRVTLSGGELRGSRTLTTDDQGRFSFTALPAGRFSLGANKPGHVSVSYGQRRPGTQGTQIQLGDGQKFEAHLQIPRGSVLTGTILDENGEATPGTNVRALRVVNQGGRRTLQSSGSGTTDDRGIYRIHSLQPGDYVVCATPRNTGMPDFERAQVELQALRQELTAVQAAGGRGNAAQMIEQRLASLQATAGQQPQEPPPGYAPICYPGTMSATEATPVALGISEERPGIDLALQLVPMARVSGTVMNSTGAQLQNLQITLQEAVQIGGGLSTTQTARADAEGRFRFNGVPPGQYKLNARAQVGGPAGRGQVVVDGAPLGGRGVPPGPAGRGGPAAQRPDPVILWGAADIVVDGRPVENVMVTLQNGLAVSGQIAFEGSVPPPADLTRMRVTLNAAEPGPMSNSYQGRVDANGRFTVSSVPPGRYRVGAGGAPGWFLESANAGGQDALDFPFEIKGGQGTGNITLTFTDKQTELTGTIVNDQSQPAVDYTLIIFPADNRYWVGQSRRIQTARPGTDGRFTVRNLPPGDYKIATVLDLEPGSASDPAFLQQIEGSTMRLTLQPGEKKQQDIRLSSR